MRVKAFHILLAGSLVLPLTEGAAQDAETLAGMEDSVARQIERGNAHFEAAFRASSRSQLQDAAVKYSLAIQEYRRAVTADPRNLTVHRQLARALHLQGRHWEAAEAYGEVVRLAPADIDDRARLADALYRIGDHEGAIEQLEIAKSYTTDSDAIARLDQLIEQVEEIRLGMREEGTQ